MRTQSTFYQNMITLCETFSVNTKVTWGRKEKKVLRGIIQI